MKRSSFPTFTAALLLGSLAGAISFACLQGTGITYDPSAEKSIERLIQNLGSSRFEDREAATRALMKREDAEPALRKALRSEDLEIRRRAADILKALARKRIPHRLAKARALAREGRAIEAADRLVYYTNSNKLDEEWGTVMQLADKLIDSIPSKHDRHSQIIAHIFRSASGLADFPAGDFHRFINFVNSTHPKPKEISGREVKLESARRLFVRAERVSWGKRVDQTDGAVDSIIIASGDVHVPNAHSSIIIAGGNVIVDNMLRYSIIICDKDVEPGVVEKRNLIIARGKVPTGRLSTFPDSMVRSEGSFRFPNGEPIAITDKTPDPFAFVKFFELADVGLTAADRDHRDKPIPDGVFLKYVRNKSPFAPALRAGDVITALDGKKTPSKEDFRRLLRRKLAEGGPAITFTVRRAEKTMDVAIPVKD